ncbi:hypothetical protein MaudCBS49596_007778 [Microsporum audouinii]
MTLTYTHSGDDDAPPPYTPTDPLTPASTVTDSSRQVSSADHIPSYTHAVEAPNFVSAAAYFSERRPPANPQPDSEPLEHALIFYKRSQAKDYSRYPRCWRSKAEDITQHDWDTFLNYLLPLHLGPASSHPHMPQKLRAEIERDRKDRPQETDEERQWRITAVVTEWNFNFFLPRGVMIVYCFVREDGTQPETPLCPSCYPNTTSSRSRNDTTRSLFEAPTSSREIHELPQPSNPVPIAQQSRQATDPAPEIGEAKPDNQYQYSSGPAGAPGVWIFNPGAAVNNIASMVSDQIQRYSQYVADQAVENSRRVSEQVQAASREVQNNAQAHANYVQQQATQARHRAYYNINVYRNQAQSTWAGHHARFAGYGPGQPHYSGWGQGRRTWGPSGCHPDTTAAWGLWAEKTEPGQRGREWGHIEQRGRRARSASVSPSSSSSSSSSSESLDSASSDSGLKKSELAALKAALNNLKEQQEQRRVSAADYRARRKELKRDYRALRSARREFRSAGRRCRGSNAEACTGSSSNPAARGELNSDIDEIKKDMQEIKDHYINLIRSLRNEKHELKQAEKSHKQEEKQARKEEKQARKQEKAARKEERKKAKDKGKGKAKEPDMSFERQIGDINLSSNTLPPDSPQAPQTSGTVVNDVKQ